MTRRPLQILVDNSWDKHKRCQVRSVQKRKTGQFHSVGDLVWRLNVLKHKVRKCVARGCGGFTTSKPISLAPKVTLPGIPARKFSYQTEPVFVLLAQFIELLKIPVGSHLMNVLYFFMANKYIPRCSISKYNVTVIVLLKTGCHERSLRPQCTVQDYFLCSS